MCSSGISTFGLFSGGAFTGSITAATTGKYTYSSDFVAAGTNLTTGRFNHMGTGSLTLGIFTAGQNNTVSFTSTEKYTYSGDAVSSGTAYSGATNSGTAPGSTPAALS
jgi:hypothetical protein